MDAKILFRRLLLEFQMRNDGGFDEDGIDRKSSGMCFEVQLKVASALDLGDRSEKEKSRMTSRCGNCFTY
jgi:hypothetical protein